eukprot:NODE_8304_length_292_cov_71.448560_g7564_i0.p2 GENE.NODE_8304_length_292_cov_71.448560_g7564_i0~~NODE_8304_length_292_cov_71.448560_g7564_i0.p2  ORF type:complete len:61 (-),score=11.13 NODE_8304_length_292_cov_71.448560_g7564_i0:61-243(-)
MSMFMVREADIAHTHTQNTRRTHTHTHKHKHARARTIAQPQRGHNLGNAHMYRQRKRSPD